MKLINGDCREYLFTCEPNSIDLTVTSPPYDNLRTYNNSSTWGWAEFAAIAAGLWRVTKLGGVVVWVVGDATIKGSETGRSFEQALFFKKVGFNLHDTMAYRKMTPPLTHNRYEQRFEYMMVLSKGKPTTFNSIMVAKKYMDKRTNKAFTKNKDDSFDMGFSSPKKMRIKGNIWEYLVGGGKQTSDKEAHQHPAIFPEQLAYDHIISWSNEGDMVFDPLMGSGTTGKMAKLLNRDFIGIEIDKEYFEIAKKRIEGSG